MKDLEFFRAAVDKAIEAEKASIAEYNAQPDRVCERRFSHKGYSYGMVFNAALAQETQEDAERFLRGYIEFIALFPDRSPGHTPEQVARINLGYMAGYYGDEVRQKIERLYNAEHPIFGRTSPTAEEAFQMGQQQAAVAE